MRQKPSSKPQLDIVGSLLFQVQLHPVLQTWLSLKPDDLSHLFHKEEDDATKNDTILPSPYVLTPLTRKIEERVRAVVEEQPSPTAYPTNRLYVPSTLKSAILQWAQSSVFLPSRRPKNSEHPSSTFLVAYTKGGYLGFCQHLSHLQSA